MNPAPLYAPSFTEQSRQGFVLSLKKIVNGPLQQRVRESGFDSLAFRQWAVLAHHSQTMMWQAIESTVSRTATAASGRYAALRERTIRGSLKLDPALEVPPPIRDTEIHRQPGGYLGDDHGDDLAPGLRYLGAAMIYSVGKGREHAAGDGRGKLLIEQLAARRPRARPRRILDLGCGIALHAQPIALAYPDAEYHAIDVAAGLLRFAHLAAEERGVPIHFHQRDAANTGFEDASFDFLISNIFFHETSAEQIPRILRECRRLLAPGGLMLHVDVATQRSRLSIEDQLLNAWQDRWNGEPFWTGFAAVDMRRAIIDAGFAPESVFALHVTQGGGVSYVFGAG